jgi:hypothetical protein
VEQRVDKYIASVPIHIPTTEIDVSAAVQQITAALERL